MFAGLGQFGDFRFQALEVPLEHRHQFQVRVQGQLGGRLVEVLPAQPGHVVPAPVGFLRVEQPVAQQQRIDPLLGVGQVLGGPLPRP